MLGHPSVATNFERCAGREIGQSTGTETCSKSAAAC